MSGSPTGARLALQLAATYPERCSALVLWNTAARHDPRHRLPVGCARRRAARPRRAAGGRLGREQPRLPAATSFPVAPTTRGSSEHLADLGRTAVSPGVVAHVLPGDGARRPAVVPLGGADADAGAPAQRGLRSSARMGRYVADHIADARYVEIDGTDHIWWTERGDEVIDEIEEFLTGRAPRPIPTGVLATVLFTDIVGSTATGPPSSVTPGGAPLLDQHDEIVRSELARFGGREIDSTGDGFLATFDGPGARHPVRTRDGRHAGRDRARDPRRGAHRRGRGARRPTSAGIAVHIGARVAAARRRRRHRRVEHREGTHGRVGARRSSTAASTTSRASREPGASTSSSADARTRRCVGVTRRCRSC